MPRKSRGHTLRRLGSDDLRKGARSESAIMRYYVRGVSAAEVADRTGLHLPDVERKFDEIETRCRNMDNEAFRLKVVALLFRSESRASDFRRAVRHFKKTKNIDMLAGALRDEREEDAFQLSLLTRHLITDSSSANEMAVLAETIRQTMEGEGGPEMEATATVETTTATVRTSMAVGLRSIIREDAGLDPEDEVEAAGD